LDTVFCKLQSGRVDSLNCEIPCIFPDILSVSYQFLKEEKY
jgi:hypothetical protein